MEKVKPVSLYSNFIPGVSDVKDEELAPVIMVHGTTESRITWQDIYEDIALETGRKVFTVDARNHGDSEWSDIFDFDVLAVDLNHFMEERNIHKAILIGHSMGGKTVMTLALNQPEKVEKLIVEDISPRDLPQEIATGISEYITLMKESLALIPVDADEETARKTIRTYINNNIPKEFANDNITEKDDAQMLLSCTDGVYKWKLNLDAIQAALDIPGHMNQKLSGVYEGESLFIYGKESPFKVNEDEDIILKFFPKARLHGIEGASHTLHKEFPEFLTEIVKFINE